MANKIFFSVFLWLCCFISASAQVWPKYYGQQNRREFAVDIIETYDKGYLICGYYNSPDYTQRWGWLIKTDVNGEIIWEKILENTGSRFKPFAIEQAQDGGILICGMSRHADKNMPIVLKLNACGEKQWCKLFADSPNNESLAVDIKETETGDIVVLVNMFGSIPQETIHLFKLSTEGEVLWQEPFATTQNYPNTNIKLGRKLLITNDNKYLISGYGYWEQPWNPGGPMPLTSLFIMVDSDGNEEWVLPFGLNDTILGIAEQAVKLNNSAYLGFVSYFTQGKVKPGFAFFNSSGDELMFENLENYDINPILISGAFSESILIDTILFSGGGFILQSNQQLVIVDCLLTIDADLFLIEPYINHIYFSHGNSYNNELTFDNKLLSASDYYHSSNNHDIFLAKLNLNLEYDTAYTGNFTYDSLCIPGPPQSGFIYLNDCAIDMDLPGDSNCDAAVNVNDVVSSVARILGGNPQPFCLQNADVNGDGVLNVADVVGTVSIIISRRGRY
jgi:hypothetical protein